MSKRILYVDDEPFFIEPIVNVLIDNGYQVDLASDGTKAINKLLRKSYTPDLIILDVFMSAGEGITDNSDGRRTGIKIYEIIRKHLNLQMPILFITVIDDQSLKREITHIESHKKFDDFSFLVKPVLPNELLEKVASMIDLQGKQHV